MTKSEIDQSSKLRILSLIPLAIIVFIAVSCVNGQQKTTSGVTLIEPLNMNILYVGVDNPVKISTSGYDLSELTATVDNGTISGKEGTYIITPKKPGKANVSVSYKGKVIQTTFFRVKPLPSPIAMISGTKGGNISKEKLLKAKAIYPIMENFDFEAVFEIEGFTVSTIINGYIIDEVSTSNEITANQRDLITKTGIGQELFFKKIKCKGPDGTIKELPVIDVIITE